MMLVTANVILLLAGSIGSSSAAIVGPYSVDADTLHLWHLDEAGAPALDAVSGGMDLAALSNGATLGNSSVAGFGAGLNTGSATSAYLAALPLVIGSGDDTTMSYADPVTGAFTYEALVRVDFDPATFTRALPLYLITGENDGGQPNSTRAFQFRMMPSGATLAGSSTMDYRLHFFNPKDNGSTFGIIPTTGSNAIAFGNWYHVAVTYNGEDNAENNIKLFWTLLDVDRIQANELDGIVIVPMTDLSAIATPDFTLGNVGRTSPSSNWPGIIDEVRISRIARGSTGMLFNSTKVVVLSQPASQTVAEGNPFSLSVTAAGIGPLSYQWRYEGDPISGATESIYSVNSASPENSGSYDVVVNNNTSLATSEAAVVTVARSGLVSLHIERYGQDFLLSWPLSTTPWTLESTTDLTASDGWEPVAEAPVISGDENLVLVPSDDAQRFFRLTGTLIPRLSDEVVPINWSAFQAGVPSDVNAQRVSLILQRACQYAMTTWWNTARNFDAQEATYILDFGGTGEFQIRSPAMEAYGLAVALQTGIYDATLTGVSANKARGRTLKMIRSLGYRHRVNETNGWGNVWQSAHWAALTGTAAWMLWDELPAVDQENIRRMAEYEANRFLEYTVPYYMNRAGTIVYPGDTKAEENAWNASILHLAFCMMPAHPNATVWRNKALELTLSTHARPSDMDRTDVFHGKALAEWLNGSNANEDSTLINHNFIHPDYIAAGLGEFQPALVYLLGEKPVPAASFFNLDKVYQTLVDLEFVVGAEPYPTGRTNRSPGGSMYVRDIFDQPTSNIYYSNGNDWGTMRRMHFATMDATVNAFGLDGTVSISSSLWEAQHNQIVLDMQARFSDGRTYGLSSEDTYSLREEWVCNYAAKSFLTKWLVHQGPVQVNNGP